MSKEGTPSPEIGDEPQAIVDQGLGKQAIQGISWRTGSIVVQALGQIVYTAVMSRLVSPEAFGLVAMTIVARGVGSLLTRMGIGQALIQKPTLTDEDIRAGATLSVAFGALFFGLSWLFAPAFADLFDEPKAIPVIRGASFVFLALGLLSTSNNLLRRDLRFKESSIVHMIGFFVGYFVIGVGLAVGGAGVWALVAAPIAHTLVDTVLMYALTRHPIRPTLNLDAHRALLSYGTKISLIQVFDFFGGQGDTVVVGRFAGTELLGIYNRAFYVAVLPLQMIMSTMHYVLFSSFSRIQNDIPRLTRVYVSTAKVSAALFFPASAAIAAAGYELILVLLGNRYREAAILIPFFAVYAAMSKMSSLCGVLCEARAELNKRLALQAGYVAFLIVALLAVSGGPLWAYGAVLAVGETLRNLTYNLFIVRKIIPITLAEIFVPYVPALFAAGLVVATVGGIRFGLITLLEAPSLVALVVEGVATGLLLIALIRRGPLSFLRNEILSRIQSVATGSGRAARVTRILNMVFGPPEKARA